MPVPPLRRAAVVSKLRDAGCVFAEDEAQLLVHTAKTPGELASMVERRAAGMPLEHVVGWADFCGLRVAVNPGVFVPRRRTELLVRRAVAVAAAGTIVVDLACGSGAVGMAVAALVDGVALYAVDIEPAAVACARRNLGAFGGKVYAGDLYAALPDRLRGSVDVLVANVPYVPTEAVDLLPREARVHEPRVALDGGPDGLDLVRRVAEAAPGWLAEGGHLLVETSADQADAAIQALGAAGLTTTAAREADLAATVVIGRRKSRPAQQQTASADRPQPPWAPRR
jgi:release factor glutamine methyltransferase